MNWWTIVAVILIAAGAVELAVLRSWFSRACSEAANQASGISDALDRNELGALLVAAELNAAAEHALISLLALNRLRVSETTGANIKVLGVQRGHQTLVITRKGCSGCVSWWCSPPRS